MNVQAHMTGGQVPNTQNGNPLPPNQMHNLVGAANAPIPQQHNMLNVDNDLFRARTIMRERM